MAVTTRKLIVKAFSKDTHGIQSADDVWYNEQKNLSEDFKKINTELLAQLGKGDTIELMADFQARTYNTIKIIKKGEKKDNWADNMTNFDDLLADAHKKFKHFSIHTEKIEINVKEKYALFKATLTNDVGTFEAHGDATKDNIDSEKVQQHFIRMAETRSICRALRFATNNTACATEETEEGEDSLGKEENVKGKSKV